MARPKDFKFTEEMRLNMSKAHLGKKHSEEQKRKISASNKGKIISSETRDKLRKASTGKKHTIETRKKMSKDRSGENSPLWRGGISKVNQLIRASLEYKLWRTTIFIRDNRKCIWCGSGQNIEADHIKPFAYYPELRFAIDNGRTLCRDCHKTTDTYSGRAKKNERK